LISRQERSATAELKCSLALSFETEQESHVSGLGRSESPRDRRGRERAPKRPRSRMQRCRQRFPLDYQQPRRSTDILLSRRTGGMARQLCAKTKPDSPWVSTASVFDRRVMAIAPVRHRPLPSDPRAWDSSSGRGRSDRIWFLVWTPGTCSWPRGSPGTPAR